jgi:hypothetical protein
MAGKWSEHGPPPARGGSPISPCPREQARKGDVPERVNQKTDWKRMRSVTRRGLESDEPHG